MKQFLAVLTLTSFMFLGHSSAQSTESAVNQTTPTKIPVIKQYLGHWQGSIPGLGLKIGVSFKNEGGMMQGKINIPMQAFKGKLKIQSANAHNIIFSVPSAPGNPIFNGQIIGKQLRGKFTQGSQSFDFQLKPSDSEITLNRPQEPKPPYPYLEEEVTYKNGDITLAGTLTKPKMGGPFTAVLMITGSDPQNRDSTFNFNGHKPFLVIADHLTRAGYAVLRVDDRGVGGSSGKNIDATLDDFTNDILAGVQFLKSRSDIKKIGVFGHSEGGYTGPMAANKSKDIDFVIMMAGPAVSGAEILKIQQLIIMNAQGKDQKSIQKRLKSMDLLSNAAKKQNHQEMKQLLQELVSQFNQSLPPEQRASKEALKSQLQTQLTRHKSRWFRSFIAHEPKPFLENLNVPVFAFFGGKDTQVPPKQSVPPLKKALANNKDATIHIFPQMNHMLQKANTGFSAEYSHIEETINPKVLKMITDWLKKRF